MSQKNFSAASAVGQYVEGGLSAATLAAILRPEVSSSPQYAAEEARLEASWKRLAAAKAARLAAEAAKREASRAKSARCAAHKAERAEANRRMAAGLGCGRKGH